MKIWFNQSFSMRNVIAHMVRVRPNLDLCVSAIDTDAPVRDVAPDFWVEPPRGTPSYPQWVLDTAIRQNVDALVPQRGRAGILEMVGQFHAAGIALHAAGSAETLALLDNKALFSKALEGDPMLCPTCVIHSAAEFETAFLSLTANGGVACVKPSIGIYGAGYWTLNGDQALGHLSDPDSRRISSDMFSAALRAGEQKGEQFSLLVMEHLPGLEASVDIVADRGRVLLAAVRTKLDANRQRIQTRHLLIEHATSMVARFALHGALNVQYKQDRAGQWRILEINPRAAGGASYCDEIDIPFSATWLGVIVGDTRRFSADVDIEIVAVTRAEPRRKPIGASQKGSAGTNQA